MVQPARTFFLHMNGDTVANVINAPTQFLFDIFSCSLIRILLRSASALCLTPRCWSLLYAVLVLVFLEHVLWIMFTLSWTALNPPPPLRHHAHEDAALETLIMPQLRLMRRVASELSRAEQGLPPGSARVVDVPDFSQHCQVYVTPSMDDQVDPGGIPEEESANPLFLASPTSPPPPFRIYVYDLPAEFNAHLVSCVNRKYYGESCFNTAFCGAGVRLGNETAHLYVHDTWQFSLELLLHHKLLFSPYRTKDPAKADVFYVPYYAGLDCFCGSGGGENAKRRLGARISKLFQYLRETGFLNGGKAHLMTLSKIQREHFTPSCPLLRHPDARSMIFAGLEEESSSLLQHMRRTTGARPMVVIPYPSYAHLNTFSNTLPPALRSARRHIFLFLAAGRRKSNAVRTVVQDQFHTCKTTQSYNDYFRRRGGSTLTKEVDPVERDMVWLVTNECRGDHKYHTLKWMRHSVFCIQPPGDSPTRKSFYDAALSGCVPVLFPTQSGHFPNRYPFSDRLPYANFTLTLPPGAESELLTYLRGVPRDTIRHLQEELLKAARYLQYSLPIANTDHNDAVRYMLDEIQQKHL